MQDRFFELDPARVEIRRYPQQVQGHNIVRVFRHTPERVQLQIRGATSFAMASLTAHEARQAAAALIEGAIEIERRS